MVERDAEIGRERPGQSTRIIDAEHLRRDGRPAAAKRPP